MEKLREVETLKWVGEVALQITIFFVIPLPWWYLWAVVCGLLYAMPWLLNRAR